MNITVNNLGRRFNREWIFRRMNYQFEAGGSYAVLGPNGSGKSTFIQVLSGSLTPSEGILLYIAEGSPADNSLHKKEQIAIEEIFARLSFAAPYLELIEEFTLEESIDFHFRFKKYTREMDRAGLISLLGFEKFSARQVRYFSSGMKQRLKLALAVCSDTPLLLLDEPTANFDEQGIGWFHSLIERFAHGRTLIVCSNQPHEYSFCSEQLHITDFK